MLQLTEPTIPSPCLYGEIVEGHACYCELDEMPTKCPIYKWHGLDLNAWHPYGDFLEDDEWESGCACFEQNPAY